MFRFRSTVLPALGVFAIALAASAGTFSLGKPGPRVAFHAVGPAGFKIDGTVPSLSVADDGTALTFTSSLTGIKTGIGLRDDHCKDEVFEIGKGKNGNFDKATLVVQKSALKLPEPGQKSAGTATGKFSLHGVTKDLPFKYSVDRKGGVYTVNGKATIDVTNYKIKKPCKFGVCVEKDVDIAVDFTLNEK